MSLAGSRVAGQFTLIRPLGRGASSLVYLALGDDGQPYTVKLFESALIQNAHSEARMQVRHPRLAEVVALTELSGCPVVVLRFTRGLELFGRYASRPAMYHEPRAFLRTLSDVLEGLAAMHSARLLHRDVKADNVLVQPSGEAKLLDYDLSGPMYEQFEQPRRIGTAAFQSPEAARGEALGPQSDLWGIGVLLYWGLHGSLPDHEEPNAGAGPLHELSWALLTPDAASRPDDALKVREELLEAGAEFLLERSPLHAVRRHPKNTEW